MLGARRSLMMNRRVEYVARDSILKLLSEAELARVSTAETAKQLATGEEYIDLAQLERGVRTAPAAIIPTSRMLPRNAVHGETWSRILAVLAVT